MGSGKAADVGNKSWNHHNTTTLRELCTTAVIGTGDNAWTTQGESIGDAAGYTAIGLFVTVQGNDSTGLAIRFLPQLDSDDEGYPTLDKSMIETPLISNGNQLVFFDTLGVVPMLAIQTRATVLGATPAKISIQYIMYR